MAPKKKQKEKKTSSSSRTTKPSSQSSSSASSSGTRLQISAQNESRLRRLLLNSSAKPPAQTPNENLNTLSTAQHAKRLHSVYEKLSCEGFTDEHIERALSALKDGATFENALDWLCLNLAGNELPLKFSSGSSLYTGAGSISVISTGLGQTPSNRLSRATEDVPPEISVRTKGKHQEDDSLDSLKPSQADWIKRYVQEQDEDEDTTWEDNLGEHSSSEEVHVPRSYDIIAQEYYATRMDALTAKEKGDKQSQERAGRVIRELKKELAAIGMSDDILASIFEAEHAPNIGCKDKLDTTLHQKQPQVVLSCDTEDDVVSIPLPPKSTDEIFLQGCSSNEAANKSTLLNASTEKQSAATEEPEDVELSSFFEEEATYQNALGPEKTRKLSSSNNLEPLVGIWKKGDPPKIPKALLHQLCQKSGWEAPKFNKMPKKDNGFSYKISILRMASGRGKSRKAGGLITLQLPDQDAAFESSEEAQNGVAAFALNHLFPDVPVHLAIVEPYASFVIRWKEGESSADIGNILDDRRTDFVDSLLRAKDFRSNSTVPEELQKPQSEETLNYPAAFTDAKAKRINSYKESESFLLKQELENKKKTKRYRNMLDSRSALPIAELKGEILQLLKDNDVVVVCGETGSGKTTQVPQFILDEMIEAGSGGDCSIVCTQPRRIAAISVAERVADERCETSPGTSGSVVGYQVRLDSARNEKTKLLFCTTGILLRRIAGDKSLSDITHVIVDEVHERSLLGDFLLIVLKNLIEKQTTRSSQKLKVILMSATVDSKLFSKYFSNCPVVTAMGRTHPVTTYFLEDVYEIINYRLESDSPACIRFDTPIKQSHPVNNSRGNRNLVLSAWGDDSVLLDECINPYYISENYQSYSQHTRQNLKKLNEDVIDYDLLEDLVCHIDETCPEGAILIFLPGVSEINMLLDKLSASYQFGGSSSDWLLPLHSSVAPADQRKVLLRPPESIRKVIIATNIAETSITIDDVVYVIDCGKHKENRYNPQKKLSSMVEDWISRANAKQRRGRAGRVKPGICYCLYTCYRFEKLMRPFQVPEILRMPLVELCLQIKLLSLGNIRHFLSQALEPPKEESITSAISLLYEVGAVERDEELTPLGYHLAKLPVDVLIGKMLVYGGIFGCLSPILSVSAFLSYKSPFAYPKDERQNVEGVKLALLTDKLDGYSNTDGVDRQSDHLLMMVAYRKWEKVLREKGSRAAQQFCNLYFLSSSVMHMIRDMRVQFGTLLADIGLIDLPKNCEIWGKKKENLDVWLSDTSQPFNVNSQHAAVVKAILCAGLYPNVAATEEGIAGAILSNLKSSSSTVTGERPVLYDRKREVHIHPSSINSSSKTLRYPFVVFLEKVETNKIFLRDTTVVSPYSILLFGGSIDVQHQAGVVTIDGWLKLIAAAQTAVLFKQLRVTLQDVLKEFIRKPQKATAQENEVVRSIVHLLLEEAK